MQCNHPAVERRAGFYLDKHQSITVACDNIYFPGARSHAFRKNSVTFEPQIPDRYRFGTAPLVFGAAPRFGVTRISLGLRPLSLGPGLLPLGLRTHYRHPATARPARKQWRAAGVAPW